MANENNDYSSVNIDDYKDYNFKTLPEDKQVELYKDDFYPTSYITRQGDSLIVRVHYEYPMWDYWLRNYSVNKVRKAFNNAFEDLEIEGVEISESGLDELSEEGYLLFYWTLKMQTIGFDEMKQTIITNVDVVLFKMRLQLVGETELTATLTPQLTGIKKYFLNEGHSFKIGWATFWVAISLICGASYLVGNAIGNNKYDLEKYQLLDENKQLKATNKNLVDKARIDSPKTYSGDSSSKNESNTSKILPKGGTLKIKGEWNLSYIEFSIKNTGTNISFDTAIITKADFICGNCKSLHSYEIVKGQEIKLNFYPISNSDFKKQTFDVNIYYNDYLGQHTVIIHCIEGFINIPATFRV